MRPVVRARSRRPAIRRWADVDSALAGPPVSREAQAYIARANNEVAVLVMVESADAVANIDALLQTPGLDGIMVGPADLAVTMGHLSDLNHPDVSAGIADVRAACQRNSVPFGIFAATQQAARRWAGEGAAFMTIGADTQFLDQGIATSRALAESLRESR